MPVSRAVPRDCRQPLSAPGARVAGCADGCAASAAAPSPSSRTERDNRAAIPRLFATIGEREELIAVVEEQDAVRRNRRRIHRTAHVHLAEDLLFLAGLQDGDV